MATAVTAPLELEAVSVYAVDVSGEILLVPVAATAPTVGLIETDVAFDMSHLIDERSPSEIIAGSTEKLFMTGRFALGAVTVAAGVVFLVVLLVLPGAAAEVVFAVAALPALLLLVAAEGAQAKQIHNIVIRATIKRGVLFNYIFLKFMLLKLLLVTIIAGRSNPPAMNSFVLHATKSRPGWS